MNGINTRFEKKAKFFFCFIVILGGRCFGQDGSLDASFGNGGKVATTLVSTSDHAYSVVIQADEKLVVGGRVNIGSGNQGYDFGLARYNTNGSLDASFGVNGKVITDFFNSDDVCYSLGMQPDQKIIAAGYADNSINGIPHVIAVARYNVNGTLDNSFGINGKLSINYGFGENFGKNVSILPDGSILIAGTAIAAPNTTAEDFALIKLKANGDFDSSFGTNGKVLIDFNQRGDYVNSMITQSDGKIVLGGQTVQTANTKDFGLVRLNSDGSIDLTFGTNGRTITDFQNTQDILNSISLQSDGKIVAAGYTNDATGYTNFSLCRYLTTGNLDPSFANNGKSTTFTNADYTQNNSAVIQPDDKIIIAGNDVNNFDRNFHLIRYNKDGSVDPSFGNSGRVYTNFGSYAYAHSVLLQPDGKIVAAGVGSNNSVIGFAVARYNNVSSSLPIKMTLFTAYKGNRTVVLNWHTSSEINNKIFIVERSSSANTSANNFQEIGSVKSRGRENESNTYNFIDEKPLNSKNYYRLKQVDHDGNSTYSKIVNVDFGKNSTYKIYSNPVKDILHISNLSGSAKISILSLNGSIIDKKEVYNSSYNWNVKYLSAGNYYLQIEENKKVTTLKIVKQ